MRNVSMPAPLLTPPAPLKRCPAAAVIVDVVEQGVAVSQLSADCSRSHSSRTLPMLPGHAGQDAFDEARIWAATGAGSSRSCSCHWIEVVEGDLIGIVEAGVGGDGRQPRAAALEVDVRNAAIPWGRPWIGVSSPRARVARRSAGRWRVLTATIGADAPGTGARVAVSPPLKVSPHLNSTRLPLPKYAESPRPYWSSRLQAPPPPPGSRRCRPPGSRRPTRRWSWCRQSRSSRPDHTPSPRAGSSPCWCRYVRRHGHHIGCIRARP